MLVAALQIVGDDERVVGVVGSLERCDVFAVKAARLVDVSVNVSRQLEASIITALQRQAGNIVLTSRQLSVRIPTPSPSHN